MEVITHLRSGRWDRSPESLCDGLDKSVKLDVDVMLLTEVADGKRPQALREWCKSNSFGMAQDVNPWQSGEVAALWDTRKANLISWDTVSIGPDLGPGLPLVAVIIVLRFNNGTVGMFSTTHMPSAVEGTWFQKSRRIVQYGLAANRYRRKVAKKRKRHQPDYELLAADWNLNVLKTWVQEYFKRTFPKHKLIIANGGGTHGDRQIDAALVRSRKNVKVISVATVLKLHRSSDHRAVEVNSLVTQTH